MADSWYPAHLLRQASIVFDNPGCPLADDASAAGKTLFASGATWMRRALEWIRGESLQGGNWSFNILGLVKYGLASAAALAFLALAWFVSPWWASGVVPAFYAVEAQWVFLFPVALDGSARPFREARQWTKRAGGTLRVMGVVLPLAATMLFGGFLGRGFVRCWCLGCLAVCLWYEDLRKSSAETVKSPC